MKTCYLVIVFLLAISGSRVLATHKDPSRNLYRFLTLLSGYFDSQDQQSTDHCTGASEYHEPATVVWKPVEIDSLHDQITLYYEVAIAGHVLFREIWVVYEDRCGVIHVNPLTVLDCDSYEPRALEHVDFNHIRYEPLTNNSDCEILFYSVDVNDFVGTAPGCLRKQARPYPISGITLTCYSTTFHVCDIEISDKNPILPYIGFKKYSYLLTSAMTKGAKFHTECFYPHD